MLIKISAIIVVNSIVIISTIIVVVVVVVVVVTKFFFSVAMAMVITQSATFVVVAHSENGVLDQGVQGVPESSLFLEFGSRPDRPLMCEPAIDVRPEVFALHVLQHGDVTYQAKWLRLCSCWRFGVPQLLSGAGAARLCRPGSANV